MINAFSIALLDQEAAFGSTSNFNPGTIVYAKDGTLTGIGVALTELIAGTLGEDGRTNSGAGGRGYRFQPLISKKYQASPPQLNFQWNDSKTKDFITVTYLNPVS